jgi:hypothetical protein
VSLEVPRPQQVQVHCLTSLCLGEGNPQGTSLVRTGGPGLWVLGAPAGGLYTLAADRPGSPTQLMDAEAATIERCE